MVRKVACGLHQSLREGDVLLTLNGNLVTRVSELDVTYHHDVLDALVVRERQEIHIQVATVPTDDVETKHALMFCGAGLQRPHQAVLQQISYLPSEIYVSFRVSSFLI